MDQPMPSYRQEFFKSPHHAWMGIFTLGLGFATGLGLGLVAGVTAYIIGWIYLPDSGLFRRWVDRRRAAASQTGIQNQLANFNRQRQMVLSQLSTEQRNKYQALAAVCADIEKANFEDNLTPNQPAADPRLRKLDELMWTYLKLLLLEQNLANFLEQERRENLPEMIANANAEAKQLITEVEALKAQQDARAENREKLLASKMELLEVLQKRLKRLEDAESNCALVVAEQQRLDQQIKLVRADALATKNASSLSARIDETINHLDSTNKWLAEMEEFKDMAGDFPQVDGRIGYTVSALAPPPLSPPRLPSNRGGR